MVRSAKSSVANLPPDWRAVQIRNVASTQAGGRLGITKGDYQPTGFPAFSASGQDGFVNQAEYDCEAVVVASIGARCGKAFLATGKWATLANTQSIFPAHGLDAKYLWYVVNDEDYWHKSGSAQPFISPKAIQDAWLPLPPLPEQKKIAAILSSVDEAIQATQAVIEQTRRVKEGLLQELLTRGMPGHTRYKKTEVGEIPESWEVRPCENLATQISVGIVVKPTQYYVDAGVKCWRSANVGEGFVRDSDWVHISAESNRQLAKTRLNTGDIVVVRTGYPGTACVVPPELDQTNCVDLLFVRPKRERILPTFLCYFINSGCGKGQVLKGQGGLAQKHFNVGELNKMYVAVPPKDEQASIVAHLDEVQASILAGESHLHRLSSLKAGLLQDLLTGKVRVRV